MTRLCEVCDRDLDELGKRPDAEVCSAACRRRRSRQRRAATTDGPDARSTRARPVRRAALAGPRPGVSVYLPSLEVAREAMGELGALEGTPGVVAVHAALVRAVRRRERVTRAGSHVAPGVGGTGAAVDGKGRG